MKEIPVDLLNEEFMKLFEKAVQDNPDLLGFLSPDPRIRLAQYDRWNAEGRLFIKPKKPKVLPWYVYEKGYTGKKRYDKEEWKDWMVYFVLCRMKGFDMDYEDLVNEMYDPTDPKNYPYNVQTVKNKFWEFLKNYK